MKPQVVKDLQGYHGSNLEAARSRIIQSGSWKKQRIVVVIPAGMSIPAKVAFSHWNLIFPPNNLVAKFLAQGMEVGEAYSSTIEMIMSDSNLSKWEYLLTIEHDNIPPNDGVLRLIERMEAHPEFACIGGLYFTKGHGGVAQIWGDINDPVMNFRPQPPVENQLIECWGTGMGFNLFRLKMFRDEKLRRPWFKTQKDSGGVGTQDLYFWSDAHKYGYRCAIDCSVLVGHYDEENDMVW
jgi:hypothetical protein